MSWNFGYETPGGSSSNIANIIGASKYTNPTEGEAQSITAYLNYSTGYKIKAAIYDAALNKVGETEEWTPPDDGVAWHTFNFITKPELAAADYILAVWAKDAGTLRRDADEAVDRWWESHAYNSWPASLSASDRTGKFSVFCTVEEVYITHEWEGSDGIAIGEVLSKTSMKVLSDGFQFSDVVVKEFYKTLTDAFAFTDTLVKYKTMLRTFTDGIAITDTLIKSMSKVLSDGIAFTDKLCLFCIVVSVRTLNAVRNNVVVRTLSKVRSCWFR